MAFGRSLFLVVLTSYFFVDSYITGFRVADVWAALTWNRFPSEVMPLILTPFLEDGRIHEAQTRSRVRGLIKPDEESYAGYFTVNKTYHSNMFFWFFPAQRNSSTAPVLLWLNGGPSRSSVVGAMLENGPLVLTKDMKVQRRNTTWTKSFSMLYVDNPVGTGYSFTLNKTALSETMKSVSHNLYSVLIQFLKTFPQYSKNDLYVGGQSYAGKYVPSLGYYIHERNHDSEPPELRINFKGIYLGAGFCDPQSMLPVFPDFLFHVGMLSEKDRRRLKEEMSSLENKDLFYVFGELFREIITLTAGVAPADHIMGDEHTLPISSHLALRTWMDFNSVRIALHVGLIRTVVGANDFLYPENVMIALRYDMMVNTNRENGFLMDNYKVLHYSGNLDTIVSVPMSEAFLEVVPWSGQAEYKNSSRSQWHVNGEMAGYFTKIKNFTRVIIRNSGHMVPYDQPEWALEMMEKFVFDRPFN